MRTGTFTRPNVIEPDQRERGGMSDVLPRIAPGKTPEMNDVRVGCSGWNYAHWREGVFYPPRCPASRWLPFYAERFDTVEVNSTFYRLPRRDAVARWVQQTPPGFVFAVKVSRYLTHIKRLREIDIHLPLLLERIAPLVDGGKLGPLLWQLPPTFARDEDRLAKALAAFPSEFRHAIEFRHQSWFAARPLELLAERNVALVTADRPGAPGPAQPMQTADFSFVRFHYGARGRRGNYSDAELSHWAGVMREWADRGDVYAYFNTDWEGFAPRNALAVKALTERVEA
jgi:uncharacterized protein YecE (DUF72 family)